MLVGSIGLDACDLRQAEEPAQPAAPPSAAAPRVEPAPSITPIFTPTEPALHSQPTGSHPGPRPPLEVRGILAQDTFLPGEHISITWALKNVSAKPVTLRPLPPAASVHRVRIIEWPSGEDNLTGYFEAVRSFPAGTGEMNLQPGETTSSVLYWDQRNSSGWPVAPGYYWLTFQMNIDGGWSLGDGSKVLVRYPQGAMEKSLEVDQSRTSGGVTITVKRVELSATGTKVYALATPPDFRAQTNTGLPLSGPPVGAQARYQADGHPLKLAGSSGAGLREDGIELVWDSLDPMPEDARLLRFTITYSGLPTIGIWEFEIPLR
ncbi:MAG: hypothetical protein Q7R39_20280 [Dehalococcoidia bacterium]|nr:hypothetical protein [Dehalococcoidia bacterium]